MFGLEALGICWGLFNSAQAASETAPSLRHPGLTGGPQPTSRGAETRLRGFPGLAHRGRDRPPRTAQTRHAAARGRYQHAEDARKLRLHLQPRSEPGADHGSGNLPLPGGESPGAHRRPLRHRQKPPCPGLGHIAVRRGYDTVFTSHASSWASSPRPEPWALTNANWRR